jgi:hypothetical protein
MSERLGRLRGAFKNNIRKGHSNIITNEDFEWLIEQADKLERIRRFSNAEEMILAEFSKVTLSVIEDKEFPQRGERY